MLARLGCLFIVVPLLELALLVQVGQWVGVLPTVLLVAATGLLGAWLVRTEGVRTLARFQERLARGELPGQALMDGAAILVGGAFLLTPGVLTDGVALLLLVPFTRRRLQRWAGSRLAQGIQSGSIHVTSVGFGPGGFGPKGFGGGRRGMEQDPGERPSAEERDDEDPPAAPRPGEIVQ